MTVGISSANLATPWLNVLRNTAATAIAQPYFKLHTGDPGAAGANNAAAGDTTRKAASYAAPAAGSIAQTGTAPSWTNGGTTETLSHISVWDASSAGNFLFSFALSATQSWANTNTFSMSSYSFGLTPIAA
jgi:hypothetical protein